jgi:hypothetical protein
MVYSGVGHEHRAAQLEQHGRLDHLHMTPEVSDARAAVAEPPSARPRLQDHLQ